MKTVRWRGSVEDLANQIGWHHHGCVCPKPLIRENCPIHNMHSMTIAIQQGVPE